MMLKKTKTLPNEKNDDAAKNKKRVRTLNLILAFVLSISLWAYVIGEVNPETEKVIIGVPLKVMGERALDKQGLVVLTEFDDSISVVVKGRRNNIYNLSASKLSARVDLSDCVIGENQVPVEIASSREISDAYAKEGNIIVTVDKIIKEKKDIEIAIGGKKNKGTEVEITSMSSDSVNVSGPSTYVEKVDSVVGVLDLETGVGNYNQTVSLSAVDKDGNKVEGVELEYSSVNVVAEETLIKNISVPVQTVGGNSEEYYYHYPESVNVNIKGNYDSMKEITSLYSAPIDLSAVEEDTTANLAITIPEGITVVDDEGKTLTVDNDNVVTLSIEIKIEKINPTEGE